MYNNRYVTELSIREVKEYYEILRNKKLTHEETVDFGICKERLIEYAYKNIDKADVLGDAGMDMIAQSVANATPLPAGHGKLIDYGYVVEAIDDWINSGEYRYTNATYYLKKRIANITPTIEADAEVDN